MKRAWDQVTFRLSKHAQESAAPRPEPGDEMVSVKGRRYEILRVRRASVTCLVLPSDAEQRGKVWLWTWGAR